MGVITPADVARQRKATTTLSWLAGRDLARAWKLMDPSRPEQTRDDLIEVVDALGVDYSRLSGVAAAQWYEQMRRKSGVTKPFTPRPEKPGPDQGNRKMGGRKPVGKPPGGNRRHAHAILGPLGAHRCVRNDHRKRCRRQGLHQICPGAARREDMHVLYHARFTRLGVCQQSLCRWSHQVSLRLRLRHRPIVWQARVDTTAARLRPRRLPGLV